MSEADSLDDLKCLVRSVEPPQQFAATVVIVTKNRRVDVLRAVESALTQTIPTEVLVISDGSNDRTCEGLIDAFGDAFTLYHSGRSRGYIARRNQGARLARAPLIASIDDDGAFSDPTTLADAIPIFDDERIAAVALPYINVLRESVIRQRSEGDRLSVVDRYIGTAHIIRRTAFLAAGGYREQYVHQGEEMDLCLRLLDDSQFTVLGSSSPIHHFESPVRDRERMMYYGRQNDVLFALWNVPLSHLIGHLTYTTVRGTLFALRHGSLRPGLSGLLHGYIVGLRNRKLRSPVARRTYRVSRRLRKRGPLPLELLVSDCVPGPFTGRWQRTAERLPGGTFLRTVSAVAHLTPSVGAYLNVWLTAVVLRLKRLLGRRGGRSFCLRLRAPGGVVSLHVSEFTDLYVVREVFVDGEYEISDEIAPRRILDLGANIGVATLYFRSCYPEAAVHAVEPDARAFRVLRRNVADDPKVTIHEAAVAKSSGMRKFSAAADTWTSTLASGGEGVREVIALSLPAILERAGWATADLIKIDIEGGEWEVLESGDLPPRTDFVVGELHDLTPERLALLKSALFEFILRLDPAGCFQARRTTNSG